MRKKERKREMKLKILKERKGINSRKRLKEKKFHLGACNENKVSCSTRRVQYDGSNNL